jgi:hypothetical protein
MMFTSPLKKLRQSTWLSALPDTIAVPAIGGRLARNLSIERATLDQIAFALLPLEQERREIGRTLMALDEIIAMARKQGALGADLALTAATQELEARQ